MSIERIYITAGPYQEIISGIQMILSFSDGVVKLTGQDGAGKTSLLHRLQKHIEDEGQGTLLFSPPPKSVLELHNTVTRTFRLAADVSFRKALARHLTSQPRDRQHLVLLFDDAETMDDETLGDLLLFRNVKQGDQSLVSLVLFGSADLDARLQAPELAELVQDIVLNYELNPLNFKQLAAFCEQAIPALGLRIALPGTRELEHLLQVTGGLPGAVLEQLPVLATNPLQEPGVDEAPVPAAGYQEQEETQHPVSSAESITATQVVEPKVEPKVEPDVEPDIEAAVEPPYTPEAAEELSLVPLDEDEDDEADDDGRRRKILAGGLALAASLAAAWFFFPQLTNLLRSPETTIVATRTPAPVVPADPAPAPVAPVDTTLAPEPVIEVAEVPVEEGVEEESAPLVAETGLDSVDEAAVEDAPAVAEEAALAVADEVVEEAPATELAAAIDTDEPTAAATPVSTASVVPVLPAMQGVAPTEANLLAAVEQWVDAWQAQNLDGYFSAYHTDFAPLYQSTRAAWRDNRVRSIQRPAAINIALEEFRVVGDAEVGMQVAFWLNYQSPDYADRTYKELVIGNDVDGSLRILREANRQVIAAAPGAAPSSTAPVAAPPPRAVASTSVPTHTRIGPPVPVGSGFSFAVTPRAAAGVDSALAATLHDFVGGWLGAWQRQDLNDYFAHYHPDFKSGTHASREAWAADRRDRIARPLLILIRLTDLEVGPATNGRHEVVLEMEYHSTYYADRTVKEVSLARKADGSWGIISERNREVSQLPISRLVPDRSVTLRNGPGTVHEIAL